MTELACTFCCVQLIKKTGGWRLDVRYWYLEERVKEAEENLVMVVGNM